MNIVVTGSSGFLGRALSRELLSDGNKVYGIDIKEPEDINLIGHKDFECVPCDLSSEKDVNSAFEGLHAIDLVFHTAAIQPVGSEIEISRYMNVNVQGAINLLKACDKKNVRKIIVSSSFSVYGIPEYLPIDEIHPTKPNNAYGLSKLCAENLFEYYARTKDFNIMLLRMDGIYGSNQTIPGMIEYLISAFKNGNDVELFNRGKQERDNVFVGNVVEAHIFAMKALGDEKWSILNIGGKEPKSSERTAKIIKRVTKSASEIILSEKGNPLVSYDIYMTSEKATKVLGYQPTSLEDNLVKILNEK